MNDLKHYLSQTGGIATHVRDRGLRPPPRLDLSSWADEHFRLSAESAAVAGRWNTLPYQRDIMNAISDRHTTFVSVMKSARVGFTLIVSAAVGYYIHQAPCSILLVQPNLDDVKGFSKETIAPMLRDVPVLAAIAYSDKADPDAGVKDSGQTIAHKRFPGGVLSMVGANSGAGFRRISRKVVIFDEVDAYPASAGSDGDPIKLGMKRAEYFWDRKIIAGSTPLLAGSSRIESLFLAGDQRYFYVPCTQCGHMDRLVFTEHSEGGHFMVFDKEDTAGAHFVCSKNGCVIEHKDKRDMVARGEWRASKPFAGHASFHIWAAYSFSPNATWSQLADEFLEAKAGGRETLKTFINTVLGETWKETGDVPDWERLYERRERYAIGSVPAGVEFLTCGVDVQKNRWVYEVVGWGVGKESWSIDAGVIMGDTSNEGAWSALDELLERTYPSNTGALLPIRAMAVDSGYNTQVVYNWGRTKPGSRVLAVKGVSTARSLMSTPTPVDVDRRGQKIRRGYRVWPVGVDIAKAELYGFLRLSKPVDGQPYPPGYCHFPEHAPDFFRQLTAEHLVSATVKKTGYTVHEWHLMPGRENHWLDARVYSRAAAAHLGIDRMISRAQLTSPVHPKPVDAVATPAPAPAPAEPAAPPRPPAREPRRGGLNMKPRRGGGWFGR